MRVSLVDYLNFPQKELCTYTFSLKEIPRLVLQELSRHRAFSLSVKSSRYTLAKELKDEEPFFSKEGITPQDLQRASKYIALHPDPVFTKPQLEQLEILRDFIASTKYKSDDFKFLLPESWLCDIVLTTSYKGLENFLNLRLSPKAHFSIRYLATLCHSAVENVPYNGNC